jgi:hypothetical protein
MLPALAVFLQKFKRYLNINEKTTPFYSPASGGYWVDREFVLA